MGIDVIENSPSSSPPCSAIRSALNDTARMPGRKRWRSYHNVAREYGNTLVSVDLTARPRRADGGKRQYGREHESGAVDRPIRCGNSRPDPYATAGRVEESYRQITEWFVRR